LPALQKAKPPQVTGHNSSANLQYQPFNNNSAPLPALQKAEPPQVTDQNPSDDFN
jgi:hypothetical protein